ncbi:prepilin-type N-terminal cleavage/methylation domain-containing protein [Peptoclostridium litorale DSM 5388]|uniref:Prepilin-type N-terminal cleavage/methylation domain-containing protein n=1 Tax=Peptoclostridium litorale DSM 5388 TaxID=1121324 RepID=A0A069RAH6_PEPLI|nr:prepilin-type N-terminal cleavage/methylation domain-containing protein [Peptoclostridium litorale]KDR93813.1 hypothetical protein CLIT_23c00850 [Peptoclostridium litorale DSM 5388]SIN86330.1 prepilin-type N-terminal cleavage/methylation domain-containing protein [Peptoclostridium litorale DSM 5388]
MKGLKKLMNNKKGFTLIELIVVIAVLGLIAAIAVPRIGGVTGKAKTNSDKQEIAILNNALEMYISESGDTDLSELTITSAATVITDLKNSAGIADENDATKMHGPYLRSDADDDLPSGKKVTFADKQFK